MKWFAEVTEWKDLAPNHVYLMDDSKSQMYAYVPTGATKPTVFKAPIRIDVRGRKFKINPVQFKTEIRPPEPEGRIWEVQGSKGDIYKVTEVRGEHSCTCSGFKFRGDCKHIKQVR